jgi:hypothetical protein
MECKKITELLSGYIDGELSGAQAESVEAHLAGCADCRRAHEEMSRLVGLMRDMDTIDEPADLIQNVRGRLASPPTLWERLRGWFSIPAVRIPAAATVLAAILLVVLYVPGSRDTVPIMPEPAVEGKGKEDLLDVTLMEEREELIREMQEKVDDVEKPTALAGDEDVVHQRGGRAEEVAVQMPPEALAKKVQEQEPSAPEESKREPTNELRSQDALVPGSETAATAETPPTAGATESTETPAPAKAAPDVAPQRAGEVEKRVAYEKSTAGVSNSTADKMTAARSFVTLAIDSVGGEIVEWVHDERDSLSVVVAAIPAGQVEVLRKKLGDRAEVLDVMSPMSAVEQKSVTVRIRIRR